MHILSPLNKTKIIDAQSNAIHNSQMMETDHISIKRGMDRQIVVHTYSSILFSHKKEKVPVQAIMWMNLQNTMRNEKCQT